jgi:hypothetical protein
VSFKPLLNITVDPETISAIFVLFSPDVTLEIPLPFKIMNYAVSPSNARSSDALTLVVTVLTLPVGDSVVLSTEYRLNVLPDVLVRNAVSELRR